MKTYIFEGLLISGSGILKSFDKFPHGSDVVFCNENYSPACVDIGLTCLNSPGLFEVRLSCASDLKYAFRRLKSFLLINSFDFYFDFRYKCISDFTVSTRYLRPSQRLMEYL